MQRPRDSEFEAFVRANRGALVRTASALTAGDLHAAEDLVQSILVRLYLGWPRARRTDVLAYARRALVNALIDEKRRPFGKRERVVAAVPERPAPEDSIDARDELLAALAALPAGMRAAVVLRHVEGFTVEQTAVALNCSTGTVKSQTSRGLDKLRETLSDPRHYEGAPK